VGKKVNSEQAIRRYEELRERGIEGMTSGKPENCTA